MLQKLSLTPKRKHESTEKALESEEDLLYKLKGLQAEQDYLHIWTIYEKLATMVEERSDSKAKKEYAKQIFYLQSAAQALVKMWRRDSDLPFEQYFAGDIARLYNRALEVAIRHIDHTVVHTIAREGGLALLSIGKFMEARDIFVRAEQHLVAVPSKQLPDFMERLIVLYGIMDTLLHEERYNEYMVYTDKIWMMTMKEEKRCAMLENVVKERVECSERHKRLLDAYRTDAWSSPIIEHNPPLTTLNPSEQKIFRRFLFYMISKKRSIEKASRNYLWEFLANC
uniref:Uncharacterized protein n=1 Tax=Caenorhabditis japonica TaxID=281687 RepID=A0A8R1E046_CAEJA